MKDNLALARFFILAGLYLAIILVVVCFAWPMRPFFYSIFGLKWYFAPAAAFVILYFFVPFVFLYCQQRYDQETYSRRRAQLAHLKRISATSFEIDSAQLLRNIPPFILQMYREIFATAVDYAAVYFYDKAKDDYKLFSFKTRKSGVSFAVRILKTDPIPVWFCKIAPMLVRGNLLDVRYLEAFRYEDIIRCRRAQTEPELIKFLEGLCVSLETLKVSVAICCFYKSNLLALLFLGKKQKGRYSEEELDIFNFIAHDIAVAAKSEELCIKLEQSYVGAIHAIITALEEKDYYTKGHSERVVKYSMAISEELKNVFPFTKISNFVEKVRSAALLHDVGKIGVPDEILLKRGKLMRKEFEKLKKHPHASLTILDSIKSLPEEVRAGIESHHEKYDGTGYTKGAKGHRIPPIARIIAAADSYDAMTSDRAYREAMPPKKVIQELLRCTYYQSPQWDSRVIEALLKVLKKDSSSGITDKLIQDVRLKLDKEKTSVDLPKI